MKQPRQITLIISKLKGLKVRGFEGSNNFKLSNNELSPLRLSAFA